MIEFIDAINKHNSMKFDKDYIRMCFKNRNDEEEGHIDINLIPEEVSKFNDFLYEVYRVVNSSSSILYKRHVIFSKENRAEYLVITAISAIRPKDKLAMEFRFIPWSDNIVHTSLLKSDLMKIVDAIKGGNNNGNE